MHKGFLSVGLIVPQRIFEEDGGQLWMFGRDGGDDKDGDALCIV